MEPVNQPKTCHEKLAFDTQKEARVAAMLAKYQHGGKPLKTYLCTECQLWHLASTR